jgi:hypothetical protein
MGFYLVGIIYATPASFSTNQSNKKRRSAQGVDFDSSNLGGHESKENLLQSKRIFLPTPMVLNFTLVGLTLFPLITNQILASLAGSAFDRGDSKRYSALLSAMYGVWSFVVAIIFILYIFFGK